MNAEWDSSQTAAETERDRPVGPGARLCAAREARGLSLAQAAEQLKLKQGIIAALEQDDYQRLPSILFARGYLRSYARLLELPVTEVIATFEQLGLVETQPALPKGAILTNKRRGEHLLLRWGSLLVVVVLGALLVAWFQGESTSSLMARLGINGSTGNGSSTLSRVELPAQPPVSEPSSDTTPVLAAPPAIAEPAPETELKTAPTPQVTVTTDSTPPAAASIPATTAVVEPTATAATPESQPDTATSDRSEPVADPVAVIPLPADPAPAPQLAIAANGSDRLVLELLDDSWAEVTDARGERLVYQLLKAGTVREVIGQGPFALFLGNAPGVELRFNGEPVTDIRISSRGVARLTLGAASGGER